MTETAEQGSTLITLTAEIVSAHVANNSVAAADLTLLIQNVYGALSGLQNPVAAPEVKPEPAVSVRVSVKPDFIICLEDGKKLKMLKRHLMTHYKLTPADYRAKWNLPADYPMVAPNYAEHRRSLAKKIGLGHKPRAAEPAPVPEAKKAPAARRPRKKPTQAEQPAQPEQTA